MTPEELKKYSQKYNDRAGAVSNFVGRNMTTDTSATAKGIGALPTIGTSPMINDLRDFSRTGNRLMSKGGTVLGVAGAGLADYIAGSNLMDTAGRAFDEAWGLGQNSSPSANQPVTAKPIVPGAVTGKPVNPGITQLLNEPMPQPAAQGVSTGKGESGWSTGIGGMDTSKLENPTEFMFTDASGKVIKPKTVDGRNDWSAVRDKPGGTLYARGIGPRAAPEESVKKRLTEDAANHNSPSRNQSAGILATMEGHKASAVMAKQDADARNEIRRMEMDQKAENAKASQEVAGTKMLADTYGVYNDDEKKDLNMDLTAAKLAELVGTGNPAGYEKLNKYPIFKQAVVNHMNKFSKWIEPRMAAYKSANPGMSDQAIRSKVWTSFNEQFKPKEPVQ